MTETTNTIVQPGTMPVSQTVLPQQYQQTAPVYQPSMAPQFFTAADIEAARRQEKDKLYDQIERQKTQLDEFKTTVDSLVSDKKARDDELARQQKAVADAAASAQAEKLTAQELIAQKQAEWEQQQAQLKAEMDLKLAGMQKEQEFLRVKSYAQRRVNEEINAGNIIPDLAEYIDGADEQEIEASITKAKEKTNSIVMGAAKMTAPVPGGVSPTGGPSGPLDNLSGPRQITLEELQAMPVNSPEYLALRKRQGLDRAGNGQGLFG
jgi:hypothetical protein